MVRLRIAKASHGWSGCAARRSGNRTIRLLALAARACSVRAVSPCILPRHLHLLLITTSLTCAWWQRRGPHRRPGPLFQLRDPHRKGSGRLEHNGRAAHTNTPVEAGSQSAHRGPQKPQRSRHRRAGPAADTHLVAGSRAAQAAARVAARYAQAPSYDQLQSAEVRTAVRAAEIATQVALEAQAAARAALAGTQLRHTVHRCSFRATAIPQPPRRR